MSHRPCSWPRCPNTTRRGSGRCHVHRYADRDARDREPPPRAFDGRDEAVDALRVGLGRDLRIDTTVFVSGAYSLDVRSPEGVAVVEFFPPGKWHVSTDRDGAGPDRVADSLRGVVNLLRVRLDHPSSGT